MKKFNQLPNGDTLIDYIAYAQESYRSHEKEYDIPFEDEKLIWIILDWGSMFGEFTEDEKQYLEQEWNITEYELKKITEEE